MRLVSSAVIIASILASGCSPTNDIEKGCESRNFVGRLVSEDSRGESRLLEVEEAFSGAKVHDRIRFNIAESKDVSSQFFFVEMTCIAEDRETIEVYPVYDIAPDRFEATKAFFKKNDLAFYINSLAGRSRVWVPVACETDLSECARLIERLRFASKLSKESRAEIEP